MAAPDYTILSDFLTILGVRHTDSYTNRSFRSMPFPTMFGLKKLLATYGVESVGLKLADSDMIDRLPTPFIAQTSRGMVIVTAVDADTVMYVTQSVEETAPKGRFSAAMTGNVFVAFADDNACEPGYAVHRFTEIANIAKKWVLAALAVALLGYAIVTNGIYRHISTVLLTIIDIAGVYISTLLVMKSAHIKSRHADAVCSVVQAGGCDDTLATPASKFVGIFGWSEVGLAYFGVSLGCLLMFPDHIDDLALCNLICLPFSFWSVWYQKFKAKSWCTLCLCVQSLLWLSFFCYLGGGWLRQAFHPGTGFLVLGACYVAVMLAINAIIPLIDRNNDYVNSR